MTPTRMLAAVAPALIALNAPAGAQTLPAHDPAATAGTGESEHTTADRMILVHSVFDQFEGRVVGPAPAFRWSGQGWIGTDYDKFWVKTEGFARSDGSVDDGKHEFLYSRAVSTYFDLQAGLRSDIDSRPTRHWAALGLQGLEPLFVDLEATVYARDGGRFAAHVEASYDLLITNRLILQPLVEIDLYTRSDPARLVGAGLSEIDAGLRLRYELTRKFAPYIGVAYEGKFGRTASFARRAGESAGDVRFVFGVRSWF
jgi:copper resistance protein B